MGDWLDELAEALDANVPATTALADGHRNVLLGFARDVAHGTERKNAPLAAYIVGRYVSLSSKPEDEALAEALEIAASILPEPESA